MRIYASPDGKQLLCDLRPLGGRDIALGTLDPMRAAARAAEIYARCLADRPIPGTAKNPQLELPTGGRVYMLSEALSYLVARGTKRDATKKAHEQNSRYLLAAIGDRDVNSTDWYDVFLDARDGWLENGLTHDTCNKRQATLSKALKLANRPLGRGERFLERPAHLPAYLDSQTIARTRWFQPEEIAAFVDAILTYDGPAGSSEKLRKLIAGRYDSVRGLRRGRAVRFLIRSWTGVRNGDARRLKVADFNLVTGKWLRPSSKKNHPAVWLEMVEPLRLIVEEWLTSRPELRRTDPILYRWPNERRGLLLLADHLRVEPCTPHDYRRTAAHLIRLCNFDKDYCRRWLGLAAKSHMLDEVYLQDDPLARPDPARVRDVQRRIGMAVKGPRARRLTPYDAPASGETVDVEYSSTSNQPPNRNSEKQKETTMKNPLDELASRRKGGNGQENSGGTEAEKGGKEVGPAGFEPAAYGLKVLGRIDEIPQEKGEITPLTSKQPPKSPGNSAPCMGCATTVGVTGKLYPLCASCQPLYLASPPLKACGPLPGDAARAAAGVVVAPICRNCGVSGHDACAPFGGSEEPTPIVVRHPEPFDAGPGVCGDRTESGRFYCDLPRGHGDRHFYGGITAMVGRCPAQGCALRVGHHGDHFSTGGGK